MRYPGLPFTQKVRAHLRKTLTAHPNWHAYRKFSPHNVPHLHSMTRDQLLDACEALAIDVWAVVEASGARTNRRHRTARKNEDYDRLTDAALKLEGMGYLYAGGKWQERPDWLE